MIATEEKNSLQMEYRFIDESFDKSKAKSYRLILQISVDKIVMAVKLKSKNSFVAFESFLFSGLTTLNDYLNHWDILKSKSNLLTGNYSSTLVIIVNNHSTIVPEPLYEEGSEKQYLDFNIIPELNEFILTDTLKSIEAKNIFSIPIELKTRIDSSLNNIEYIHYSSILIENLLVENKNKNGKNIYLHLGTTHFEILLHEGRKLLYYNTFNYYSKEDLIYYLLFVCEQLNINPSKIEIKLLGEVDKKSELIAFLKKYINKINFTERNTANKLTYGMQTLPNHYFYTVLSNNTYLENK